MNVSKLLRFLLARVLCMGVVELDGVGTADDAGDDDAGEADESGAEGDDGEESDDGAEGEAGEGDETTAAADDEVEITLGEADPDDAIAADQPGDSSVIKTLRERVRVAAPTLRRQEREIQQLREELQALKGGGQSSAVVVGEKPTLEGCDFDGEKLERELEAWMERKRQAAEQVAQREKAQQEAQQAWKSRLDAVQTASAGLKVKGTEAAVQAFEGIFSTVQQAIVLDGPTDPKEAAMLRHVLGANPGVAKKLADIQHPVKYAFAVAKVLYKDMNVKPRKAVPPPDRPVRSSVAGAATTDNTLEKLREEAAKTGDLTKLMQHRAQLRAKQRA